jgi:hypothetical protein
MGQVVDVGLAVSSHVAGTLATATFDNVTVTEGSGIPTNTPPTVALTSPVTGTTATAPADFALTADAADADGTVAKVEFYAGATLVGTATSAPYTASWTPVPAGTYTLTAVATDDDGAATISTSATVTVNAPTTLPTGWDRADIGAVPFPGKATFDGQTFSVTGSGLDIWGTSDQFGYAYRPLTGDGSIIARVASIQNVAVWVKAGLMIREMPTPDSAHAFVLVSSGKGVAFQRREATGGESVNTAGSASRAPRWIKLARAGNIFTAYESADGITWTTIGTDVIPMANTVYVGLAVTSHTLGSSATCTFDHVIVQ